MKNMTRRFFSLILVMVMVICQFTNAGVVLAEETGYAVTVLANTTEVKAGETVSLTAKVTYNGQEITDLEERGLKLWFWDDVWSLGIEESKKLADGAFSYGENVRGYALTTEVVLSEAREYSIVAELQDASGTLAKANAVFVVTADTTGEKVEVETATYAVEVFADKTTVKAGEKVCLTAKVTKNGSEVTNLEEEGIKLWFWTDVYSEGRKELTDDVNYVKDANGYSFTAEATLPTEQMYYIVANIEDSNFKELARDEVAIKATNSNAFVAADDNYTVEVTVDNLAPKAGNAVAMTAKVTKADGTEVTDLVAEGVSIWWWTDSYNDHSDGLSDTIYSNWDDNSGNSFTADVTLPSIGTYYIVGQLEYNGTKIPVVIPMTTTEPEVEEEDTYITGEISVEKIKNLPEDFIMGMDISSVVSLFESGVTYKDFEGNTIDNITDFCKFLASNGITHIRVRVWNNPYDAAGNGYGGGNCDVSTAAEIAAGCREAGLKMLIDFHCSDLWADPGKQQAPKAWKGYTLEQKADAVEAFIGNALAVIDPNCETVDMVQVGNETTNSFVGVSGAENMCKLFDAGSKAVRSYNDSVKVVIHVTNPEKGNATTWAKNLDDNKVDYDVLATSYYP